MDPKPLPNQRLIDFDTELFGGFNGRFAGVDEAGRGPLAGPVVAACVIVLSPGFTVKIDDSKKLTPRGRDRAFGEILTRCLISVASIDSERIDGINIYQATLEAMRLAFRGLKERPEACIVDGHMKLDLGCPVHGVLGGDGLSLSVACASITAKVVRDRIMSAYHERYPWYGFIRNKGYGTSEHLASLKTYGPSLIHRASFEPVRHLIASWRER